MHSLCQRKAAMLPISEVPKSWQLHWPLAITWWLATGSVSRSWFLSFSCLSFRMNVSWILPTVPTNTYTTLPKLETIANHANNKFRRRNQTCTLCMLSNRPLRHRGLQIMVYLSFVGIWKTNRNISEGHDKWSVGTALPAACMARAVQDVCDNATVYWTPPATLTIFHNKEFSRHNSCFWFPVTKSLIN